MNVINQNTSVTRVVQNFTMIYSSELRLQVQELFSTKYCTIYFSYLILNVDYR